MITSVAPFVMECFYSQNFSATEKFSLFRQDLFFDLPYSTWALEDMLLYGKGQIDPPVKSMEEAPNELNHELF